MMRILIIEALLLLLSACVVSGEQINLSKDSEGWTIFTPSADSKIVYVDTASGNDTTCKYYLPSDSEIGANPFVPTGAVLACATSSKANSLTSGAAPDWLLYKRGTVENNRLTPDQQGRSATEPRLVSHYGATGALPVMRAGLETNGNSNTQYIAIVGIDFYRDINDPNSPNYSPETSSVSGISLLSNSSFSHTGILIEGCKIRWFQNNINANMALRGVSDGLTIRRNIIHDASSRNGGHSQGCFIDGISNLLIEENVFDHNGWRMQNDGDGSEDIGEATAFNHNLYVSYAENETIKNNIFMRPSSENTKNANYSTTTPSAGLLIENNLFLDGEIAVGIGASDQHLNFGNVAPIVRNNIYTRPGVSNATNREFAWFLYLFNLDGGEIYNNIMIHQTDNSLSGQFFHIQYSGRDISVHDNIVHDVKNIMGINIEELEAGNPARSGISFTNNKFNLQSAYVASARVAANMDGYSFSGNRYYSTRTANTWFYYNSADQSDAAWISETDDNSTFAETTFPESTRDVDTYMGSIGETATIDAFIAAARAQERYNWDTRITANAVNTWIRQGFGIGGKKYRIKISGD